MAELSNVNRDQSRPQGAHPKISEFWATKRSDIQILLVSNYSCGAVQTSYRKRYASNLISFIDASTYMFLIH